MSRVAVLCVDDEPHVIGGLTLQLRRGYDVTSASNGAEGLNKLKNNGPFAVVLSDMRMPGMDGATFLEFARDLAPDTIRILLTGHADLQSTIAAVNNGRIFRFLTKPCPPDELRLAVDAAAEQHRLITAERVLLEQTLHGSIKTLVDVLSLTSPVSFGRAMRIKRYITELADRMKLRERWQVEVAAMLSQLGCVTLPAETAEKVQNGRPLSEQEQQMVSRLPAVTDQLLAQIPRLDVVRDILRGYARPYADGTAPTDSADAQLVKSGAAMLRLVQDFDILEVQDNDPSLCIDTMRGRTGRYDAEMLEAFASIHGSVVQHDDVRELPVSALREGMVLVDDVRMANGMLLATRGYEVTSGFVERARNWRDNMPVGLLRVVVPRSIR